MAQHARRLLLPAGLWVSSGALALAYAAPRVLADKEEKAAGGSDRLFDPEALERGAKALREINKSPYAKQVSLHSSRHQTGIGKPSDDQAALRSCFTGPIISPFGMSYISTS